MNKEQDDMNRQQDGQWHSTEDDYSNRHGDFDNSEVYYDGEDSSQQSFMNSMACKVIIGIVLFVIVAVVVSRCMPNPGITIDIPGNYNDNNPNWDVQDEYNDDDIDRFLEEFGENDNSDEPYIQEQPSDSNSIDI